MRSTLQALGTLPGDGIYLYEVEVAAPLQPGTYDFRSIGTRLAQTRNGVTLWGAPLLLRPELGVVSDIEGSNSSGLFNVYPGPIDSRIAVADQLIVGLRRSPSCSDPSAVHAFATIVDGQRRITRQFDSFAQPADQTIVPAALVLNLLPFAHRHLRFTSIRLVAAAQKCRVSETLVETSDSSGFDVVGVAR